MSLNVWERSERVVTLLSALGVGLIALTIASLGPEFKPAFGHWGGVALAIWGSTILFLIAPFRVWLAEHAKVEEFTEASKSKIHLEFGHDITGCVRNVPEPQKKFRDVTVIAVRVTVSSTVHNAIGTLLTIDKRVNDGWERQKTFAGSQTLDWAHYGIGKLPVPINPGEEQFIQFLIIPKLGKMVELTSHNPGALTTAMLRSGGLFRFHISVSGDNTPAKYIDADWEIPVVSTL
jgi:hypothetical protein